MLANWMSMLFENGLLSCMGSTSIGSGSDWLNERERWLPFFVILKIIVAIIRKKCILTLNLRSNWRWIVKEATNSSIKLLDPVNAYELIIDEKHYRLNNFFIPMRI